MRQEATNMVLYIMRVLSEIQSEDRASTGQINHNMRRLTLCIVGKYTFLNVVIDYYSKWMKTKALASTTNFQVIKFLKYKIISKYGIPSILSSDNDSQFAGKKSKWFCDELKIENMNASVKHPQVNEQLETANKTILNGLKKRLDALERKWAEELENVLWELPRTPKKLTR